MTLMFIVTRGKKKATKLLPPTNFPSEFPQLNIGNENSTQRAENLLLFKEKSNVSK